MPQKYLTHFSAEAVQESQPPVLHPNIVLFPMVLNLWISPAVDKATDRWSKKCRIRFESFSLQLLLPSWVKNFRWPILSPSESVDPWNLYISLPSCGLLASFLFFFFGGGNPWVFKQVGTKAHIDQEGWDEDHHEMYDFLGPGGWIMKSHTSNMKSSGKPRISSTWLQDQNQTLLPTFPFLLCASWIFFKKITKTPKELQPPKILGSLPIHPAKEAKTKQR